MTLFAMELSTLVAVINRYPYNVPLLFL